MSKDFSEEQSNFDLDRIKSDLSCWLKPVAKFRSLLMALPSLCAVAFIYYLHINSTPETLNAGMHIFASPTSFLLGTTNEMLAIIFMSITVSIFFIRNIIFRFDIDKVLLALSVSFLCREIHFAGTHKGIYVALGLILIWCIRWNKRLFTELNSSTKLKFVSCAMFGSYLFAIIIQKRIFRRIFRVTSDSLLALEQKLHIPWEETTENIAHLSFIVLALTCFSLKKKNSDSSE